MPLTSADIIRDPIACYPEATVACFDPTCGELPRRQLDQVRTITYLEKLAAAGVPAALVASSTGQGHLRTVAELETWFRCAARAETAEMLLFALLRPEDGLAASERLLDMLSELNYPVVFLRPGTDLPPHAGDTAVSDSLAPFVSAAAARGLAIGLYSISDVSGMPLTAEAAAQLLTVSGGDNIVAIKVTELDYAQSTVRFLQHPSLQRLKIVQGWDPHLAQALHDGPRHDRDGRQRVGITSGLMSLAVYQYQHIMKAVSEQNDEEMAVAREAVTALFQSMQDDPRHFADLQRAKYIMGLGHPLTGTVTQAQFSRIFTALENIPRAEDRHRLARSLDLMQDGPFHKRLAEMAA
jgi:dihydrodipicolinate synthase/N-acetylneuraminate lyase